MRVLLAISLAVLSLAACDTSEPGDDLRDVFSEVVSEMVVDMPAFGGIAFEAPDAPGRSGIVVYTLGDDPSAAAEVKTRLGMLFPDPDTLYVRVRPARGDGSEALAEQVAAAVSHSLRVEYDEAVGYVRAGFWTEFAARGAQYDLERAGVPLDDVILQVEDRPETK